MALALLKGMSGVSPPSDGGYNYYQRTVDDLENEIDDTSKRAEKKRQAELEESDKRHEKELAKREKTLNETVQAMRESANRSVREERKSADAELEAQKAKTYDKSGRLKSPEAAELRDRLAQAHDAMENDHRNSSQRLSDQEAAYEQKSEEQARQSDQRLAREIAEARDSAGQSYGDVIKQQKESEKQSKGEAEKKYNDLNTARLNEQNFLRHRYENAMGDMKEDFTRRVDMAKQRSGSEVDAQADSLKRELVKTVQESNKSHADETKLYRDQVQLLNEQGRGYAKEKGQGRQDAVKEYDQDWRNHEKVLVSAYQDQLDKLKTQQRDIEGYLNSSGKQALRERDAFYADTLHREHQDAHEKTQELLGSFARDRGQMEKQMKNEREMAAKSQESLLERAQTDRAAALEGQAKSYNDTLARQKISSDEQVSNLQRTLQQRKSSTDPMSVNPAAEAALRKVVISEYEKGFEAEKGRNKNSTDSIQREYATRMRDLVLDNEAGKTQIVRQNANERTMDQHYFLEHVADTEELKNAALREKDQEGRRLEEGTTRNYTQLLERQRREYEGIIQAQREEAISKFSSQRQEADFNLKSTQRASNSKQNEIIREYDRKLLDQKSEYEVKLDEAKAQAQSAVRDMERRNKLAMDEQAKQNEQRVTQLEQQHKERERLIAQNYEDEIDKQRRSAALTNAYQQQKKS
jgi:hypothetical protein